MSAGDSGALDGVRGVYEALVRIPDIRFTGDALRPGRFGPPRQWTPTMGPCAPYEVARPETLELRGYDSFHDLFDRELDRAIKHVIDLEGPVHFGVLADRLLTAAKVRRLGSRIRARIESHLAAFESAGVVERDGNFLGRSSQFLMPPFRDWSEAPEKSRQLDHVHDSELMLCLLRAVLEVARVDVDTAMKDGIYRIGFIRLTANARERLQAPLQELLDGEMLVRRASELTLGRKAFLRRVTTSNRASAKCQ